MSARSIFARLAACTPVHVACGFLAMGGWAVWVNSGHGAQAAVTAGLVQGTISGALTLGLKRTVDWLRPRMRGALAYVAPPLIAAGCSALLLILAHGLAGTPRIWATIAVPLIVSICYIFTYNILRQSQSDRTPYA